MEREKGTGKETASMVTRGPLAATVGKLLLDLSEALQRVERCRVALLGVGYSNKRWQEIVKDVNPELRFALRPKVVDSIVTHLQSVGEPVDRTSLIQELHLQGAGSLQRIRQSITVNLRSGNLLRYPQDKIGLAAWQHKHRNADDRHDCALEGNSSDGGHD